MVYVPWSGAYWREWSERKQEKGVAASLRWLLAMVPLAFFLALVVTDLGIARPGCAASAVSVPAE